MDSFLNNKRVFVTGACGTVGHELVRQLLEDYQVEELVGVDNSESALFFLACYTGYLYPARIVFVNAGAGITGLMAVIIFNCITSIVPWAGWARSYQTRKKPLN